MKAKIYKQNKSLPYYRGEHLATLEVEPKKGENIRATVNDKIFELKNYLMKLHRCTLIVQITHD